MVRLLLPKASTALNRQLATPALTPPFRQTPPSQPRDRSIHPSAAKPATTAPQSPSETAPFHTPVIQTGSVHQHDLQLAPINPAWILSGDPVARATTLAVAEDNTLSCAIWECHAGSFKWIFGLDEIVQILEGEVVIEELNAGGTIHTLGPGDTALFPAGLSTHWTVPKYVKKFAIHRIIRRSIPYRAIRKLGRILGLLPKDQLG
jgi:uncharacterized protein